MALLPLPPTSKLHSRLLCSTVQAMSAPKAAPERLKSSDGAKYVKIDGVPYRTTDFEGRPLDPFCRLRTPPGLALKAFLCDKEAFDKADQGSDPDQLPRLFLQNADFLVCLNQIILFIFVADAPFSSTKTLRPGKTANFPRSGSALCTPSGLSFVAFRGARIPNTSSISKNSSI